MVIITMVSIQNMGFAPPKTSSRCFWNYLGTGDFTEEAHLTNAPKPCSTKCATSADTMLTASWNIENPLAKILPSALIRTGDGCEDTESALPYIFSFPHFAIVISSCYSPASRVDERAVYDTQNSRHDPSFYNTTPCVIFPTLFLPTKARQ